MAETRGDRLRRILIADDQALARTGLVRILAPEEGFDVVAECGNGLEVLRQYRPLAVDLILLDMRMPVLDGAETLRRLTAAGDAPPVLVLTTYGEDEVLSAALRAGAAGFLLKDAPGEEIVRAARLVADGDAYLDPAVTARVLSGYRSTVPASDAATLGLLTEREAEVLRLIARGLSNDEIAAALFVTTATIKTHIGHVFGKLGVRDRAGAIVYAFDHGVVRPGY